MLTTGFKTANTDQWSGVDCFEFWKPADWPLLRAALVQARSGHNHLVTLSNTALFGGAGAWDVLVGPLREDNARIVGFFMRIRDVSARQVSVTALSARVAELEQALREKDAHLERDSGLLQLVLDRIEEGVVACDASGRLSMFNRMARIWHGTDLRKIPPQRWSEYYDLFQGDGVTPLEMEAIPLIRAFNGEQVENDLISIARPGSPVRQVLANGGPLRDADGRTIGALIVMRDISAEQKALLSLEEVLLRYGLTDDSAMETLDPFNRDLFETIAGVVMNMQSTGDLPVFNEASL